MCCTIPKENGSSAEAALSRDQPDPMNPTIDDVITAIPEWRGQPVTVTPISGGITNRAACVQVAGKPYFVSIPGVHSDLLSIPRAVEVENSLRAAETGVSPRILHHLAETGVLVVEWLEGRTLSVADMQHPGMPERLAAVARRLHGARPFVNTFDLFRLTEAYADALAVHDLKPPPGFPEYAGVLAEIESAVRRHPEPPRPCSNDFCPQNLIDDGERLWLVDFGYSGNNDPCSELGNAACEADYQGKQYEALCAAYFGEISDRRLSRMHLYAVIADVAWSLWSVIQENLSDLDFDFKTYGDERWQRGCRRLDSSDLRRWLESA
jgi:thiamine kinase-like enzyme